MVTTLPDYAFLADETNEELLVIDVSDPTAPFYEGSYGTPNDAWEVAVAGEHAYVTEIESGLQVIQVFQSAVYPQYNWGRSVDVQASNDTIVAARLTATQQDSVTWELSANGGASWEGVAPDGSWVLLAAPGTDLRWRSTLSWRLSGDDPSVSDLTIDWLQQSAGIDAIADVGNDQGRQVRIEWTRSGLDFVGASPQILEYAVYRKHDPTAAAGARRAPALEGWDYVTTVPAEADERYAVVVPTLKDSTAAAGAQYSTFFIRARTATPGVHFDSAPDSGYSVDSLEPHVPTGLVVAHNTGSGNRLTWEPCPDPDFSIFRIYRSSDADFVPAPGCLVDETADSQWLDPEHDGGDVHYRVTAVDEAGNESDPATPATTTANATCSCVMSRSAGTSMSRGRRPRGDSRPEARTGQASVLDRGRANRM